MRRPFLLAVVLALSAAASGAMARTAPYVLQQGQIDLERGPDGNTVILDAAQGLIVVDTGRHPEHAKAILEYARRAGKPVVAIVNSHWHLDHTTGNRDILAVYPRARLIATDAVVGALAGFLTKSRVAAEQALADPATPADRRARLRRALAAIDDRVALVPADPVVHDKTVRVGGRRLELQVAHAAATEADLWLVAPDEKLAVAGDLVVAPVPFFDTGCEEGWAKALDAIAAARWTTLIPGHGAPMTRADFGRWTRAFHAWVGCAHSDAPAAACADGWMKDAAGFYTAGEAPSVKMMARYYVEQVLRAPAEQRMAYCRTGT